MHWLLLLFLLTKRFRGDNSLLHFPRIVSTVRNCSVFIILGNFSTNALPPRIYKNRFLQSFLRVLSSLFSLLQGRAFQLPLVRAGGTSEGGRVNE